MWVKILRRNESCFSLERNTIRTAVRQLKASLNIILLDQFLFRSRAETFTIQSNLNGSNIFGTMEICSRYG